MNILIVDEFACRKYVLGAMKMKMLSAELMTKVYSPKVKYSISSKGPRDRYGRVK